MQTFFRLETSGRATLLSFLHLVVIVGLATACGGGNSQGSSRFPTQAELDKIEPAAAPDHLVDSNVRAVETWDLVDPPAQPNPTAAHSAQSAWERMLAQMADRRQGLLFLSEPMYCLARQSGAFFLAHQGLPDRELTQFMASRCGVLDTDIGSGYYTSTGVQKLSDDDLYQRNHAAVEQMTERYVASGSLSAGIWYGRDGDRAIVMVVHCPRRIRAEQAPLVPDANGHVAVRGEVLVPAEHIEALINKGQYGYGTCRVNPRVKLPRFELECDADVHDTSAWLDIAAFPPGRILGRVVGSFLVWPSGSVGGKYLRSAGLSSGDTAANPTPDTMVSMLNQVRKSAGLEPVRLASEETTTATRVAPHFFAAQMGLESEVIADQVVLGLRAGWQVQGLVLFGHFVAGYQHGGAGAAGLLSGVLARPSGREALLDPAARFLAVGAVKAKNQPTLAAVFASYSLLEEVVKPDERLQIAAQLSKQRQARGVAAPAVARVLEPVLDGELSQLKKSEVDSNVVLDHALHRASEVAGGQAVRGWFLTTSRLDDIRFPEEVLAPPSLRLSIGVTHYRPAGEPWGVYAILLVITQPGGEREAAGVSAAGVQVALR